MSTTHIISSQPLALSDFDPLFCGPVHLRLSAEAAARVVRCRDYLDEKIASTDQPIYGINTGFGSLYNRNIPRHQLEQLQENLVKSHACGTGPEVPEEIIALMLFLKVQSLAYGYSGVQLQTVQRLADFFNHGVLPRIYEMGSLGASGDLAPLAHLALPLMGEGEVRCGGTVFHAKEILARNGWEPVRFRAKEGLALLNGTQFMGAYAVWCVWHAHRLLQCANTIAALSLDVFDGRLEPFDGKVQQIRPHAGQRQTAETIVALLAGSMLAAQPKKHVQDPYSFRCVPQVHGATADTIGFVTQTVLTEVNSVTDNPNIFPAEDQIISGGNFHGQPLALALDFLAIALAELGSISERRTYQLISGARNLPNYLVANPGIHSGMMIPQYTAAALASQNKQLCTPASVDSIVSSNGQEDHVSMGANAATKCYRVVQNLYSILAIEWLTATQALHFRRPLKTAPKLEALVNTFRLQVAFMEEDRLLHNDLVKAEKFLKETKFAV